VRTRPDHLVRVRVERDHDDRQAPLTAQLGGPADDPLMAAVHAVEDADRRDALTPLGGHIIQAVPAVHAPVSFRCSVGALWRILKPAMRRALPAPRAAPAGFIMIVCLCAGQSG
jgi:hypothetical protein